MAAILIGRRYRLLVTLLALCGCGGGNADHAAPLALRAVTFNTGTNDGLPHERAPDDGYGAAEAAISDQWYGDGLAWRRAIADARSFFERLDADVVAFQEIFSNADCAGIPSDLHAGWACEDWQPGDPTVVETVLGPDYQIACNLGRPDKCLGVRREFGSLRGCDRDFCLDALDGARVPDCGGGSRVGRGVIELAGGGALTVVTLHGTSGFSAADMRCRAAQFSQIFTDLGSGDGAPGANGAHNLVLGDFNTDPGRAAQLDSSAAILNALVDGAGFRFLTAVGPSAPPTYAGAFNIDHVLSDVFAGTCVAAGLTDEQPPVSPMVYFDHVPIVCDLAATPTND
jgi:endonuclease/exonuclease/phosphatase family metal-dependent hydrolase